MGARQPSFGAAILAESLGGERLGARKEARFRGWDGEEGRGRAGERAPASEEAAAAGEGEAAGVRRPRGAPPPVPSHPPQLSSSSPGRGVGGGDVERGRAGEPPRVGPGRTPAPRARCSARELCGGAAGVGARGGVRARGGVHVGREGVAESGPRRSRPEEASPETGKRGEGARARRGVAVSARRSLSRSDVRPPPTSGRRVGAPGPPPRRWRGVRMPVPPGEGRPHVPAGGAPWREGAAFGENLEAHLGLLSMCRGVPRPPSPVKAFLDGRTPPGFEAPPLQLGKLCPGGWVGGRVIRTGLGVSPGETEGEMLLSPATLFSPSALSLSWLVF